MDDEKNKWGVWSVSGFGWCGDDLGMSHGFDVGEVRRFGDESWASALAKDLTFCFPGRTYVACRRDAEGMPEGGVPGWPDVRDSEPEGT